MRIRTLVAPLLGTNCYLVGDRAGRCVVVDPGGGVGDAVRAAVHEDRLTPAAVVLTHGHLDHTWDAADVARTYRIPVLVHTDDAYRLADPIGSLGPLGAQIAAMAGGGGGPERPDSVEPFGTGAAGTLELDLGLRPDDDDARLTFTAVHAPGHTEGSTVFLLRVAGAPVALTGDVLFAGTIGRTDLPGGDMTAMEATLRRLALLDPRTEVLPGHGPPTSIAAELSDNPYLRAQR